MVHTFEDLVNMQQAADAAHARVEQLRDEYGRPTAAWTDKQTAAYEEAWREWRALAEEVQAAVTEHASEQGAARNTVEADVKKQPRHPAPADG